MKEVLTQIHRGQLRLPLQIATVTTHDRPIPPRLPYSTALDIARHVECLLRARNFLVEQWLDFAINLPEFS